jgi:NADH-quinone oxidoreductase subunit N
LFNPLNIGLLFLLAGFLFKLAIFPFHMWIADVYEGSSIPSAIFFSIVPKISIFIILVRIFQESFYFLFFNWVPCLAFLAVFSIVYGSFIAIKQKKMKRLLALSSIGHMGYALLAFSTSIPEGLLNDCIFGHLCSYWVFNVKSAINYRIFF